MTISKRGRGRPKSSDGPAIDLDFLLDAAARSFAINGYDATSVRKLAREIGVSHSLAHHYYDTKLDLWKACIDRGFGNIQREIVSRLQSAMENPDVGDSIREMIALYVSLSRQFSDYVLILLLEAAHGGERFDYLIEHHFQRMTPLAKQYYEQMVSAGLVKKLPWHTVFSITMLGGPARYILEPLTLALDDGESGSEDHQQHANNVAELLMDGMLNKST